MTGTSITVTLALSMLLASLGMSIANIALPARAAAFLATFTQVLAILAALTSTVVIAADLGIATG